MRRWYPRERSRTPAQLAPDRRARACGRGRGYLRTPPVGTDRAFRVWMRSMDRPGSRPASFERLRRLPVVGRAMDWGMGPAAASPVTKKAGARVAGLKATESVCPYCAVGCSQVVYTRDGELIDIEGNPRSPINQGTLCPKGAASRQLVQQPGRLTKVKYRRPHGTEWEEIPLEQAMDMIAERVIAAREAGWQETDERGWRVD